MEYTIGQVIYSKAGRDKRRPFIVINVKDEYLYLADGKLRLVSKPKKKKALHVQPTHDIKEDIANIIKSSIDLKDSDIRTALKDYWL